MIGTWTSTAVTHPWVATMLAATGVIWAAVYMLWMLQRVVFGRINNPENAKLKDLNAREVGLLVPLLLLMVFMGVYPQTFLDRSRDSIVAVQQRVNQPQRGGTILETRNSESSIVNSK